MYERAVENELHTLKLVPDHLKTQWMCERAVENEPYNLKFVPNYFKTQEICDKAVRDGPSSLQYVPDWFVTREWVYICYDDSEYCDDDNDDNFLSGMMVIRDVRLKKPQ